MEVTDVYVDEWYDGIALQRPGFIEIIEGMLDGNIDCIIVDDISRISTNMIELAYIMEEILPAIDAGLYFGDVSAECDALSNALASLVSVLQSYNEAKGGDAGRMGCFHLDYVR